MGLVAKKPPTGEAMKTPHPVPAITPPSAINRVLTGVSVLAIFIGLSLACVGMIQKSPAILLAALAAAVVGAVLKLTTQDAFRASIRTQAGDQVNGKTS